MLLIDELKQLFVMRIVMTIWLGLITLKTMMKRETLNEIFSSQTFFDTYLSVSLLFLQISVLVHQFTQFSKFPTEPSTITDEDISSQFWLMRGFAYRFYQILFLDSLSLCVTFTNLLTLLRHIKVMG